MTLFALGYILTGIIAGFLAGLLGIGGGAIMVPILVMLFSAEGMPPALVMHLALATSMATIIFTAISSTRAHHGRGAVLWPVVRQMAPGVIIGTLLGAGLVKHVSGKSLALFFAAFMALVAVQMALNFKPKPHRSLPRPAGVAGVGVGIGLISALVAIGGGSLTVPFLTWCNVKVQDAIGTSAAVGLPIAIGGTVGYLWTGLGVAGRPEWSLGFIYLPALVLMLVASVIVAPVGAKLAHRLPVAVLKRAFAGVLVLLCAKLLHSVFSAA